MKHFHSYLYGHKFSFITDHKPLTAILGPKKGIPPLAAARLQCWAWILSAYTYDIKFRPTGEHSNADGLFCLPLNRELRTCLSLLQPNRDSTVLDKQATQKSSHDRRAHDREFVVGEAVFARNLRAGPEWFLSTVVEVLGPVTYIIETDEGLRWK